MSPAIRQASQLAARGYLRLIRSPVARTAEIAALHRLPARAGPSSSGSPAASPGCRPAQLVRLVG